MCCPSETHMLWLPLVAYLTSVPAVTDAPQHDASIASPRGRYVQRCSTHRTSQSLAVVLSRLFNSSQRPRCVCVCALTGGTVCLLPQTKRGGHHRTSVSPAKKERERASELERTSTFLPLIPLVNVILTAGHGLQKCQRGGKLRLRPKLLTCLRF